jgi:hypothetical protein
MANDTKKTSRPMPRLIKAADLAARKAKDELKLNPVVRAAVRARTPRDARDARMIFDALFETTARA